MDDLWTTKSRKASGYCKMNYFLPTRHLQRSCLLYILSSHWLILKQTLLAKQFQTDSDVSDNAVMIYLMAASMRSARCLFIVLLNHIKLSKIWSWSSMFITTENYLCKTRQRNRHINAYIMWTWKCEFEWTTNRIYYRYAGRSFSLLDSQYHSIVFIPKQSSCNTAYYMYQRQCHWYKGI